VITDLALAMAGESGWRRERRNDQIDDFPQAHHTA
jgi:hypothetical protein